MEAGVVKIPDGLKEFLARETVCCLAVARPDGEVHVAPLLYWCDPRTLRIYMCTAKTSEKMWWAEAGEPSVSAAIACGLEKSLPYSLQMRGRLALSQPGQDPHAEQEYAKRASQLDNVGNPSNIMIVFTPTWARYTDRDNGYTMHHIEL